MKRSGKITAWNDERGFGFIQTGNDSTRVFLHMKALRHSGRRPKDGDIVEFTPEQDRRGRWRAADAMLVGQGVGRTRQNRRRGLNLSLVLGILFLLGIGTSVVVTDFPWQVFAACIALSVVTFAVYARDKSAARHGRWRTPENTLLVLGLIGGWPGAFAAQHLLRHKSRKLSFRLALVATVMVNVGAVVWLHTPRGRIELDRVLNDLSQLVR